MSTDTSVMLKLIILSAVLMASVYFLDDSVSENVATHKEEPHTYPKRTYVLDTMECDNGVCELRGHYEHR